MPHDAIPHQLHQTWRDAEIPARWAAFRDTWRRCWPGWQLNLWTDEDNRALVARCYPELLAIYDGYPSAIHRADLARYCWLDQVGGIYADLDCECLRAFPELIEGAELVLGLEPAAHFGPVQRQRGLTRVVSNALIAGPPGHPFWRALLAAIRAAAAAPHPLDATGPFLLTRVAEAWQGGGLRILPESYFSPLPKDACWAGVGREALPPEAVAIHHFDGTWWRSPARLAETFASVSTEPTGLAMPTRGPNPRDQGASP